MPTFETFNPDKGNQLVPFFTNAGAPSNGVTFAGVAPIGSLLVDNTVTGTTTGFYQNTGTVALPTWTALTTATGAGTYTGNFDGIIGANTPAAATLTTLTASGASSLAAVTSSGLATSATLKVDTGTKTVAATSGAATLNKASGKVTTESLVTAAGSSYTLTLTNSQIAAADMVMATACYGTASTGVPDITLVTPAAGSVVIVVQNVHASVAFNGTLVISYVSFKA
jgi:hypothetical protein